MKPNVFDVVNGEVIPFPCSECLEPATYGHGEDWYCVACWVNMSVDKRYGVTNGDNSGTFAQVPQV